MVKLPTPARVTTNWSQKGSEAIDRGDIHIAKECFTQAVKQEKNSASHRYHLALVLVALGEAGAAAEQFTVALRLQPDMFDAARRLGSLITSRPLPANVELDVVGLKSALNYDLINRDQIAETGVYYLAQREPLKGTFELGRKQGWLETARALVLRKTGDALKSELFLEALRHSIIRMPDLEELLTALRRVILLDVNIERFGDRALLNFVIALLQQCWINEFVWAVTDDEARAAAIKPERVSAALQGDVAACFEILKAALYQPISSIISSDVSIDALKNLAPRAVRELVIASASEYRDEKSRLALIPELAPINDATSRKVSSQYSDDPYPRWSSLGLLLRAGDWKKVMSQNFDPGALAFMDRPFEVLIAGCGTGVQAIAAAHAYGPNARVTAIDISKPSLAYASRMAERFQANNISFARADIKDLAQIPGFSARFDVIECVGVLHHMAEPFAGWRALAACCKPGGKMLIALYSEIARRKLTAAHSDPAYPGPDCDDSALRAYRQYLLSKPDAELGLEFKGIRDLYSTSGFRDLMLHVCEKRLSIPEIATFMEENRLAFRGFMNPQDFDRMNQKYPDEVWPGNLATWARYEEAHPITFAGMYRFWCERS
jgi:2-polyprenyl-3-methyl-5-hydroxy-6-metoxy-1,4-benzoquinol methylase